MVSLVRNNPGISRAEIAKEASLTKSTVSAIVDHLLREAVLEEIGAKPSSGGRPALELRFNPSLVM
ncbi:MAG: winged helix-turn-helix transcriptional regulator [Candidatus Competibacteraceae bacterium]|nr:winged helix-turn-helix transcriptional regulator [Candidatus Competibacteraceae bacterium]